MRKGKFIPSEYINSIYKKKNKLVTLELYGDSLFKVGCLLKWDEKEKDDFINKISNFDKELRTLIIDTDTKTNKIFTKYFCFKNKNVNKNKSKLGIRKANMLCIADKASPFIIANQNF